MDVAMFVNSQMGSLVPIAGTDPVSGPWTHQAFVPSPLRELGAPVLAPGTYLAVANARAAVAALDSTARQLPNPTLLRQPTLRREAQSTSALEGTYAPLSEVLTADEDPPLRSSMREILNYVRMAGYAFQSVQDGRSMTVGLLSDLQRLLVEDTKDEGAETGRVRRVQVVVGRRPGSRAGDPPVHAARFIPSPDGPGLDASLADLLQWMSEDHSASIDPVVAAAMAHYQFETLHPFHDGNGRIGRMLIVLQFFLRGVLSEPTLTVSPWFEARRSEYYEHLLSVSARGDWDAYIDFFATGIKESASLTHRAMLALVDVQARMKDTVRASRLRADTAHSLVDFAVANSSFTVRQVEQGLGVSYGRANTLVTQLVDLKVLSELKGRSGSRRFFAPEVMEVLISLQ